MLRYALRRILAMIPLMIGICMVSFLILQLAPGSPTEQAQAFMNAEADPQVYDRLNELYGLDRPLYVQFLDWLRRVATLDFGLSMSTDRRPVLEKIGEALPLTLTLNIVSLLLVLLISLPLGVYSAVRSGGWLDRVLTVFVFVGFSTPSFWLALLLMMLFGTMLGWLPISWTDMPRWGQVGAGTYIREAVAHGVLPVLAAICGPACAKR